MAKIKKSMLELYQSSKSKTTMLKKKICWKSFDPLIALSKNMKGIYINLTNNFLTNPQYLKFSYKKLKESFTLPFFSNFHSFFAYKKLNTVSDTWFYKTAVSLKRGTYCFSTKHCYSINKKNSMLYIDISDHIIFKAIYLLLEDIYERKEQLFSQYSYGFRQGKNCHTALKLIKKKWHSIPWYFCCQLQQNFAKINKDFLFSVLKRHIKDDIFLNLLHKIFSLRLLTTSKDLINETELVQKTLLPQILINIYCIDLDTFIENNIINSYVKGVAATKCFKYLNCITLTPTELKLNAVTQTKLRQLRRKKAYRKGLRPTKIDKIYIRVQYLRYFTNIIVGVRGPKNIADKIKRTIEFFLKSTLHLKILQTPFMVLNSYANKITFLGMLLYNLNKPRVCYQKSCATEILKRHKYQVLNRIHSFQAAREKYIRRGVLNNLRLRYKYAITIKNKEFYKQQLLQALQLLSITSSPYVIGALVKHKNTKIFDSFMRTRGSNLVLTTRQLYRSLIQNLLKLTNIREDLKLKHFLKIWERSLIQKSTCLSSHSRYSTIKNRRSYAVTSRLLSDSLIKYQKRLTTFTQVLRITEILKKIINYLYHEHMFFFFKSSKLISVFSTRLALWLQNWPTSFTFSKNVSFLLNKLEKKKKWLKMLRLAVADFFEQYRLNVKPKIKKVTVLLQTSPLTSFSTTHVSKVEMLLRMSSYLMHIGVPSSILWSWEMLWQEIKRKKIINNMFGNFFLCLSRIPQIQTWPRNFTISASILCKIKKRLKISLYTNIYQDCLKDALFDLETQQNSNIYRCSINTFVRLRILQKRKQKLVSREALAPRITANILLIYKNLEVAGILNKKKKPIAKKMLLTITDYFIIKYFKELGIALLSYYRCVDNFNQIKRIISNHLRISLLYTLMCKHKLKSLRSVLCKYGKNISTNIGKYVHFFDLVTVSTLKKNFLENPVTHVNSLLKVFCNFI